MRQSDLSLSIEFDATGNIPVFCIMCLLEEDCEIQEKDGRRILTVSGISRDTIRSHFPKADTAGVFFQPQQFIDSLAKLGLPFCDSVRYFDFSLNGINIDMVKYICQNHGVASKNNRCLASMYWEESNGERVPLLLTEQNMHRILFCKDNYFAEEKEFRILLPRKRILKPREYTIRWGKQFKAMFTLEEFFNGIEIPRQALQKARPTNLKHT